jgi:Ca-activated chloride channel family protein
MAFACLVLALANPRWPDQKTRVQTEGIAVVLALDVSGSMAERDFRGAGSAISRLDAAKHVFRLFVGGGVEGETRFEGRPNDLIGLVAFGTRPEVVCPLTLSHAPLLRMLEAERPRSIPGESETNLSDAMAVSLQRLRAAGPRRKVLVLLTDGEHNQANPPSGWSPLQAAQVARSLGIPVYTIDAGPTEEETSDREKGGNASFSGPSRLVAEKTLRDVARVSQGEYFPAADTASLVEACRQIDQLEKDKISTFQFRLYHEAAPWLGFASFIFAVVVAVLERTVWRQAP